MDRFVVDADIDGRFGLSSRRSLVESGLPIWIIVIVLIMMSTLIDKVSRSIDRLTKVLKENRAAEPRA